MTPDDMLKYMNEFDVKDMPIDFAYSTIQEQKLPYNMLNGYKLKFTRNEKIFKIFQNLILR